MLRPSSLSSPSAWNADSTRQLPGASAALYRSISSAAASVVKKCTMHPATRQTGRDRSRAARAPSRTAATSRTSLSTTVTPGVRLATMAWR